METARKKWTQPPWTPERRAKHRAGCREAAFWRKAYEYHEELTMLFRIKERYGIEPRELLEFILLMPKGQPPLTEDQNHQWRELAIKKIPAAEIYQQMFGRAA